jgi:riboflavin transporter FmnP
MSNVKKLVIAALCVAIGVALPQAFHAIPRAGQILLPMHLPVLLCGLLCGPLYGLLCGAVTPALSSLITGMPAAAVLPSMICELAVYGLVAGILVGLVRTRSAAANVYISLIAAMLCGRVIYGVVNALIFRAGDYTIQMWLTASFVTALPGIAIQIVVIPAVILSLQKLKLVAPAPAL